MGSLFSLNQANNSEGTDSRAAPYQLWSLYTSSIHKLTYRTVEHVLAFISALLDVPLESAGVQRLQQLKATQQLARNRHDGSPIVELSTVLIWLLVTDEAN